MRKLCLLIFVLTIGIPAHADPTLQMVDSFLRLRGVAPGERFTWIAMGRDNSAHNVSLRIVRGLQPANEAGEYQFDFKLDYFHSVWLVAGVDESWVLPPRIEGCALSSNVIGVEAIAGAAQFVVSSAVIYGNYIRPDGSAWTFTANDDSDADADGEMNGEIVITLASLGKFATSAGVPTAIAAGDKLLLLDPHRLRAMKYEVLP